MSGIDDQTARLAKLLEPIPPEQIEKLPKPKWKGAWDDQRASHCDECGGFHPAANTIHLKYQGHSEVTRRLLEADPFYSWEPLAYDEDGLPKLDRYGGLWAKLTVCGVTRLAYGDAAGKSASSTAIKEIIGDMLRNGAMRFGVALELWSRVDSLSERNPGDGKTSGRTGHVGDTTTGRNGAAEHNDKAAPASRAANQDALDAIMAVCNEHGYDPRAVAERWHSDNDSDIRNGDPDELMLFAATLIVEATPEPAFGPGGIVARPGDQLPLDDMSDVEKRETDLF